MVIGGCEMHSEGILKLSKIIVEKNGSFSTKDVEECGFPFETFLALSRLSDERCLINAKKIIEIKGEKNE